MELRGRNNLSQLLHVCGFDVDYVEALVLDVEVPEVDPQIIAANERFAIAVDRYAVDMVGMRVCIRLTRYCGNDGVVVCESWQLEVGGTAEMRIGVPHRPASTSNTASRRQLVRQVVLRHDLQRLLEDLP